MNVRILVGKLIELGLVHASRFEESLRDDRWCSRPEEFGEATHHSSVEAVPVVHRLRLFAMSDDSLTRP